MKRSVTLICITWQWWIVALINVRCQWWRRKISTVASGVIEGQHFLLLCWQLFILWSLIPLQHRLQLVGSPLLRRFVSIPYDLHLGVQCFCLASCIITVSAPLSNRPEACAFNDIFANSLTASLVASSILLLKSVLYARVIPLGRPPNVTAGAKTLASVMEGAEEATSHLSMEDSEDCQFTDR
jgi:hypothetical protein